MQQQYTDPRKDENGQSSIPTRWRSTIVAIVQNLISAEGDTTSIPGVSPLPPEQRARIAGNIEAYGAHLVELPEQSWETSVCQWTGEHWDVLIDLFTKEEGRSDLALSIRIREQGDEYRFKVMSVHVP